MGRKKIDNRIRTLIENCVKTKTRSFFVVVGDKSKDQVMYKYITTRIIVDAWQIYWFIFKLCYARGEVLYIEAN